MPLPKPITYEVPAMQSFVFAIFGLMLFMNPAFAADSLISSHTTHPVLEAGTSASPQASFQIARTYYLPDYQQQLYSTPNDSFTERKNEDTTNRNAGCPAGAYTTPLDASRYDCALNDEIIKQYHLPCYTCTPKPCPGSGENKETTESECYRRTNGNKGWNWTPGNAFSGEEQCGVCSKNICIGDYGNGYYAAHESECGVTGVKGWTVNTSDVCYEGNVSKYRCKPLPCLSPYVVGVMSCSSAGEALMTDSTRSCGDAPCGYCAIKNCPSTMMKRSECRTDTGWKFTPQGEFSGSEECGFCEAEYCSTGYSTQYPNIESCGSTGPGAWNWYHGGFEADQICGKCEPKACPTGTVTDVMDCGNGTTRYGYAGWYLEPTGIFSGNKPCFRCKARDCSSSLYKQGTTPWDCGFTNIDGWSMDTSQSCYSGDSVFFKCVPNVCNPPYQALNACGTPPLYYDMDGFNRIMATDVKASGDKACLICEPKQCPSGEMTQGDCYSHRRGPMGWTWTQTKNYSGNIPCGTCVAKTCPSGYTAGKTISQCQPASNQSASIQAHPSIFAGDTDCNQCVYTVTSCPSGSVTETDCYKNTNGSKGWAWTYTNTAGSLRCGTCKQRTCSSAFKPVVEACGRLGAWYLSTSGSDACYPGAGVYGTCRPKVCSQGMLKSSCALPNIWSAIPDIYSGNEQCGNCIELCTTYVANAESGAAYVFDEDDFAAAISSQKRIIYLGTDIVLTKSYTVSQALTLRPATKWAEKKSNCQAEVDNPMLTIQSPGGSLTANGGIIVDYDDAVISVQGKLKTPSLTFNGNAEVKVENSTPSAEITTMNILVDKTVSLFSNAGSLNIGTINRTGTSGYAYINFEVQAGGKITTKLGMGVGFPNNLTSMYIAGPLTFSQPAIMYSGGVLFTSASGTGTINYGVSSSITGTACLKGNPPTLIKGYCSN